MLLTSKDAVIQRGVCAASPEALSMLGVGKLDEQQTPPQSPNAQLLPTVILLKPEQVLPLAALPGGSSRHTEPCSLGRLARLENGAAAAHTLLFIWQGSTMSAVALASRRVYMVKITLDSLPKGPSQGVLFIWACHRVCGNDWDVMRKVNRFLQHIVHCFIRVQEPDPATRRSMSVELILQI